MIGTSKIYNRLTMVNHLNYIQENLVYPIGLTRKLALEHKNFTHLKSFVDNWNKTHELKIEVIKY